MRGAAETSLDFVCPHPRFRLFLDGCIPVYEKVALSLGLLRWSKKIHFLWTMNSLFLQPYKPEVIHQAIFWILKGRLQFMRSSTRFLRAIETFQICEGETPLLLINGLRIIRRHPNSLGCRKFQNPILLTRLPLTVSTLRISYLQHELDDLTLFNGKSYFSGSLSELSF